MSRRHRAEKREVLPDPKFGSIDLSKFINRVMIHGKRSIAERVVYSAVEKAAANNNMEPVEFFHKAIDNVKPQMEVRSRRVGGATYQVPVEVRGDRAVALAYRWIVGAARGRNENTMDERLCNELQDAANERGAAIKKRDDTHKMAEANKAFAHYRW